MAIDYWTVKKGLRFISKGAGQIEYEVAHITGKRAYLKCLSRKAGPFRRVARGWVEVMRADVAGFVAEIV